MELDLKTKLNLDSEVNSDLLTLESSQEGTQVDTAAAVVPKFDSDEAKEAMRLVTEAGMNPRLVTDALESMGYEVNRSTGTWPISGSVNLVGETRFHDKGVIAYRVQNRTDRLLTAAEQAQLHNPEAYQIVVQQAGANLPEPILDEGEKVIEITAVIEQAPQKTNLLEAEKTEE